MAAPWPTRNKPHRPGLLQCGATMGGPHPAHTPLPPTHAHASSGASHPCPGPPPCPPAVFLTGSRLLHPRHLVLCVPHALSSAGHLGAGPSRLFCAASQGSRKSQCTAKPGPTPSGQNQNQKSCSLCTQCSTFQAEVCKLVLERPRE